jgi:hypothetical protein
VRGPTWSLRDQAQPVEALLVGQAHALPLIERGNFGFAAGEHHAEKEKLTGPA